MHMPAPPVPASHHARVEQQYRETVGKRREFLEVCRYIALNGIGPAHAADDARRAGAPPRVIDAISDSYDKAPLDAASMAAFGSVLGPFSLLAQSFFNSLVNAVAFDTLLPAMKPLPPRKRIIAATSTFTGATLAERDIKRVSQMSLKADDLDVQKVGAMTVVSNEVLLAGGNAAARYLESELRIAIAPETDKLFLSQITAGVSALPSQGANAAAAHIDLRSLLANIRFGASSKLFLITTPAITGAWASLHTNDGAPAFPTMNYDGGTVAGIRVVASDGCPSGQLILADADGIAAAQEGVRLDGSRQALVDMGAPPDSPPTANTNPISLWPQDLAGIIVERFLGAKVARANAVAVIGGANYSGNSP